MSPDKQKLQLRDDDFKREGFIKPWYLKMKPFATLPTPISWMMVVGLKMRVSFAVSKLLILCRVDLLL